MNALVSIAVEHAWAASAASFGSHFADRSYRARHMLANAGSLTEVSPGLI